MADADNERSSEKRSHPKTTFINKALRRISKIRTHVSDSHTQADETAMNLPFAFAVISLSYILLAFKYFKRTEFATS